MIDKQDKPILAAILYNYSDPQFNANALADLLNRSVSFLCEQAYTHYGMSLHQLIETVCLDKAVRLLRMDENKIEHVGLSAGYAYTKTFRRALKKRLNLTPRALRERLLSSTDRNTEILKVIGKL